MSGDLIGDLFAGGGGGSEGLEQAFGRLVDFALNHDADALAMHRVNHPRTRHLRSDIREADPLEVTGGQPVGHLHASPDCTYHSNALGGRPVESGRRALADALLPWFEKARPRAFTLENVREFTGWGPLNDNGRPCPRRRGDEFRRWVDDVRGHDYEVEWRELCAADYGVPTSRTRLFMVARCDGLPIRWPAPTHGQPGSLQVQAGLLHPWRPAREVIDLSLPLRPVAGLAPATLARIEEGRRRYPGQPFLIRYYGNGGQWSSLDEPLHTIPTKDRFALVIGDGMRMLTPRELFNAQGFPPDYIIDAGPDGRRLSRAASIRMCGNSLCPAVLRALVEANHALVPASEAAA